MEIGVDCEDGRTGGGGKETQLVGKLRNCNLLEWKLEKDVVY